MPKALLHVFSGTGNTRSAADAFAAELNKQGWQTALQSVEGGPIKSGEAAEAADLHAFFFPVYATAMPHIVARYLLRLPRGRGMRAAAFCTNGRISLRFRDGYQGWALHQARMLLKMRGYDAFLSDAFDMPHNVTAFGPPSKDASCEKLVGFTAPRIRDAARKAAAGERRHRKVFVPNFLWCVPFGLLYSWAGRRVLGKLLAADADCAACGLCARECPANNIKLKGGRVRFGWRCEGCMRCVNVCPKRAVQLSAARVAALLFASLWNPFIAFGLYKTGFLAGAAGGFAAFLVDLAFALICTFALFVVLDWLFFALGYVPGVRRVLSWGHTKLYGRYDGGKYKMQ